jgi:hypothetical protein
MQKLLAVAVAGLLCVPAAVAAQSPTLLFKAGPTFADLSVEGDGDLDRRTALTFGGFVRLPLTDVVSLETGVSWVQKGAEGEGEEGVENIALELDYVEIPVLARFAIPSSGSVGANLFGGPTFAFEAGCQLDIEGDGANLTVDCEEFAEGFETSSFDLGIMVGGGLTVAVSERFSLLLDASYTHGLTDIEDSDEDEVKNRVFAVQAGVSFPLGR